MGDNPIESQAYQVVPTRADLWTYCGLPKDKRISLRRRLACGYGPCEVKLRPPREVFADKTKTEEKPKAEPEPEPEPKDDKKKKEKFGGRLICPKCRDILYCSNRCAALDKIRHTLECEQNEPDILKCLVNEDHAGVAARLQADPKLVLMPFGKGHLLAWAKRCQYDEMVDMINALLEQTFLLAIDQGMVLLAEDVIGAGYKVGKAHLALAQAQPNKPAWQKIAEIITKSLAKQEGMQTMAQLLVDAAKAKEAKVEPAPVEGKEEIKIVAVATASPCVETDVAKQLQELKIDPMAESTPNCIFNDGPQSDVDGLCDKKAVKDGYCAEHADYVAKGTRGWRCTDCNGEAEPFKNFCKACAAKWQFTEQQKEPHALATAPAPGYDPLSQAWQEHHNATPAPIHAVALCGVWTPEAANAATATPPMPGFDQFGRPLPKLS